MRDHDITDDDYKVELLEWVFPLLLVYNVNRELFLKEKLFASVDLTVFTIGTRPLTSVFLFVPTLRNFNEVIVVE
jgi:hypothetical protein